MRLEQRTQRESHQSRKKRRNNPPERIGQRSGNTKWIKTDIANAFYEAHVRLPHWIKRDGNKNEKVVRAAYQGLEVYYRGYIEATKESYVGSEREEQRNNTFELMERKIQEVAAGL